MLAQLYIKNYALIDETRVDFNPGLVTITGETGAGKSILLGALGLIIGNRADSTVLRDKETKCVVEAIFDIKKLSLKSFFKEHELDYDETCIIRREILPGGKSRAFVNDTPVQITTLKNLGEVLLDIHSQHETLLLKDESFQVETLDLFSENKEVLEKYTRLLKTWKSTKKELEELREKESQIKSAYDFTLFQFNELNEANLVPGEQETLETELNRGEHAEEIKTILTAAVYELEESENNISTKLSSLRHSLQKLGEYDPLILQNAERLQQAYLELKDISAVLEKIKEETEFDPAKKLIQEERLDLIYTLQKKHKVTSVKELADLRDAMDEQLQEGADFDDTLRQLENKLGQQEKELEDFATELHRHREAAAPYLEKDTVQVLQVLGMPDARLQVQLTASTEFNPYGKDKVRYLFSANKGSAPEEVQKVASGGEISRLMLALKALISGRKNQPTIIFDEIDTGVSGNIADKLGQVMQRMGKNQQVIAITHLPQIASKGQLHLKVEKKEVDHKTVSELRPLNEKERIEELAIMLSGANITAEAINNAKVLLGVR